MKKPFLFVHGAAPWNRGGGSLPAPALSGMALGTIPGGDRPPIVNALSIDLEDYYQVSAFETVVQREEWPWFESRLAANCHRLLDILQEAGSSPRGTPPSPKATFFVLGWNAARSPELIREIRRQGHEIACHGFDHRRVGHLGPEKFREDLRRSKEILEEITGEEVIGYRAPSYSITRDTLWALAILAEEGFLYDSSIFPIHHDRYGLPESPRFPFRVLFREGGQITFSGDALQKLGHKSVPGSTGSPRTDHGTESNHLAVPPEPFHSPFALSLSKGEQFAQDRHVEGRTANYDTVSQQRGAALQESRGIVEFPLSTLCVYGINLPICGGGYFRLFPYPFVRRALQRINRKEKRRFIFYLHPWELDPGQPRVKGAEWGAVLRHRVNLRRTEERFRSLLQDFRFAPVREIIGGSGCHEC